MLILLPRTGESRGIQVQLGRSHGGELVYGSDSSITYTKAKCYLGRVQNKRKKKATFISRRQGICQATVKSVKKKKKRKYSTTRCRGTIYARTNQGRTNRRCEERELPPLTERGRGRTRFWTGLGVVFKQSCLELK